MSEREREREREIDLISHSYIMLLHYHSQSPVRSECQGGDGRGRDALQAEGGLEPSSQVDGLCLTL